METNGQAPEILKLIGEWEKARMSSAFTAEQKGKMKDINNEFHLETSGENSWNLSQIYSYKFKHEDKVKQPGEPQFSKFNFENREENTIMNFILTAQDASISKIKIELDNSRTIELPVALQNSESARYSGGEWIETFNKQLVKTGGFKVNPELFKISKGNHAITFDCGFSAKEKEPAAKLEIRVKGKTEEIKGK
jgi:hypothetical protein